MIYLRVFVAVFLLLAVAGAASVAPLSSSLVLAATEKAGRLTSSTSIPPPPTNSRRSPASARPIRRRSSRADRINGKTSWYRKRFFREPRMRGSNIRLWQSRSSLVCKQGR